MNGFAWNYVDSRKTYVAAPAAETLICMRFLVSSFIDVEFESAYYVLRERVVEPLCQYIFHAKLYVAQFKSFWLERPHRTTRPSHLFDHILLLAYSCSRRGLWCVLINTLLLRARPQQKHQQDSTSVYHSFYLINIYCLPVRSK